MKNILRTFGPPLLLLGVLIAVALMIKRLSADPITYQWDLKVYYHAALAEDHGVDPYDQRAMNANFGTSYRLPFIYPPIVLKSFRPLTWFEYETTYHIWLWLKLVAAGLLLWIWRKYFVPGCHPAWLALFLLVACDAAAVLDFKAGNIAIFEQLALWLAFLAFIKHRTAVFCGIVVVLGLVKLAPVVFLALLFMPGVKRRWSHLGVSIAAFVSGMAANYLLWPRLFNGYINNVLAIRETGIDYNHALLPFLRDLNQLGQSNAGNLPDPWVVVIYCAIVCGVVGVTFLLMKKAAKIELWQDRRLAVLLTCVLYAMLMPHMKGYSYLILIPPALILMREYMSRWLVLVLAALMLLPIRNPFAPWEASGLLAYYYPLLLAYFVWGVYMYVLRRPTETKPHSPETG